MFELLLLLFAHLNSLEIAIRWIFLEWESVSFNKVPWVLTIWALASPEFSPPLILPSISPMIWVKWTSSLGGKTLVVHYFWIWVEVDQFWVFNFGDAIAIPSTSASWFFLITLVELANFWICGRSWFKQFIVILLCSRFHLDIPLGLLPLSRFSCLVYNI